MKIGLALSGGGALGAAHIGVLEEIEKNNIKIDMICGTSAGAIIGLLYADGGVKLVDKFFSEMEKAGLLSKTKFILNRNTSIFNKTEEILNKCVRAKEFSDLKIRFNCVATDINKGKTIVISSGDPVKAVMASSAYPGVFPAQVWDNYSLVDGALTRNLPASVVRSMGCDFLIGSSLYGLDDFEKIDEEGNVKANPISMIARSFDVMQKELAAYEILNCDFCFQPEVNSFHWYDLDQIDEIRKVGEKCAEKNIVELKSILKHKPKVKTGFWKNIISGKFS